MRYRQIWIWFAFAVLGIMALSGAAMAQSCTVSIDTMAFGSVRLANLPTAIAPATMRASCSGLTQVIRICPSVTSGLVAIPTRSATRLTLTLYSDSQATVPLASGMDVSFDANGNGTASQTVYGRMTFPGGSFTAGDYQAVLQLGLTMTDLVSGPPCSPSSANAARLTKTLLKPTVAKR